MGLVLLLDLSRALRELRHDLLALSQGAAGSPGRGNDEEDHAFQRVVGETHVARLLSKLGLRDRVQAVVLAYESGWVSPQP